MGALKFRRKTGRYKKKKGKRRKVNQTIIRGPSVIGDSTLVKLRYTGVFALASAGGVVDNRVFRGNSIFDPDQALGGGQPMGFDEWKSFYQRYQVTASSMKIAVTTFPGASAQVGAILYVVPTDSATAISGILQPLELPYSKYKVISPIQSTPVYINNYISTKVKFGYTKGIEQEDDLSASVSTNPIEQFYWNMGLGSLDGTNALTVNALVTLTYYVRFFDRKDLNRS